MATTHFAVNEARVPETACGKKIGNDKKHHASTDVDAVTCEKCKGAPLYTRAGIKRDAHKVSQSYAPGSPHITTTMDPRLYRWGKVLR